MPLDVPTPDTFTLNNHFILGEIIDHVRELDRDFPNVGPEEQIDQLTNTRSHKFDPEAQLRGSLKVFEKTSLYKNGYSKL